MRAVVQRVNHAEVTVGGACTGKIERGLLVFLGIGRNDTDDDVRYLAEKVVDLRIFPGADGKSMQRSLRDLSGGEVLLVSQFTLYGDCRKGRRPSFDAAAQPETAKTLYRGFAAALTARGFPPQEGVFAAQMLVSLENDGPVTILLDSERTF